MSHGACDLTVLWEIMWNPCLLISLLLAVQIDYLPWVVLISTDLG